MLPKILLEERDNGCQLKIYNDAISTQVEMQHCNALGNTFTLGEEQLAPGQHPQDLLQHLVQVVGVAGAVSLWLAVGSSLQLERSSLDPIARPSCSIADPSCSSPKLQRSIAPPASQMPTQSKVIRKTRQTISAAITRAFL